MSSTVAPEKILKELAALWVEEGKQGNAGVLRACSMTLIVIADEGEDTSALGETIAALMPEHPARAILVRLRAGDARELSERVYQQCWMPFGQRRQICCEQIELTASDAALGDLPSVLLPLIVADLPVILWRRSHRLGQMAEFEDIARLATKVVVDTGDSADPKGAISRMADSIGRGLRAGDLAWTRLTRWRETLARVFENHEYRDRLNQVNKVRVTYGPGLETAAWYLGAWAQNALQDAGVKPELSIASGSERLGIELTGPNLRIALACEGDTLAVSLDEMTNRTHLPALTDYLLMREELGVIRRDKLFERTLSSAARLALSSASS